MTSVPPTVPVPFTVALPLPPRALSPNARAGWAVRHRAVRDYRLEVQSALIAALGSRHARRYPRFARCVVDLEYVFRTQRTRDADNLAAWMKAGIDEIARWLLADDDLSRLRLGTVAARVSRSEPARVHVTLREQEQTQ